MLQQASVVPTMPVVDLEEARHFYEDKLGFEPGPATNENHAQYLCGQGTQFIIYKRPTPTQADHTALAFSVKNFEAVFNQIKKAGVKFEIYDLPYLKTDEEGISTADAGTRTAWFKDPAGNILALGEFSA